MLGNPHRVLTDIAGGDEVVSGGLGQLLQHGRGENTRARRVIAEGMAVFAFDTGLAPIGDIQPPIGDPGQDSGDVTGQANLGPAQLVDLGGIAIDVDDARARGETVEAPGGAVVKPGPAANQQVALIDRDIGGAAAMHAKHAQIGLAVGVGAAQRFQRCNGRNAGPGHEIAHCIDRTGQGHAAPDIENRAFCLGQQSRRRRQV